MRRLAVFLFCLLGFLTSCSRTSPKVTEPQGDGGGGGGDNHPLFCSVAARPTVGKPFEVTILRPEALPSGPRQKGPQPKPVENAPSPGILSGPETVSMFSQDDISFQPNSFPLLPGERKQVTVTINSSLSGLTSFSARGSEGSFCQNYIVAGFLGHLKVEPVRLAYNKARTLTVDMVDNNANTIPVGVPLYIYIDTSDALLTQITVANGRDRQQLAGTAEIFTQIGSGNSSTSQFSIISPSIWGGPVHLKVIAKTMAGGQSVAEGNFTFDTDPAVWLPISLAIGGALLYGVYSLAQDTKLGSHWKRAVPFQIVVSVVAGLLAYLTANLDLFGVKLDPNILRTYPLLGFLFAYIGIDQLFAKRFGQNQGGAAGGDAA